MPGIILTASHKTLNGSTFTVKIWDSQATTNSTNLMTLAPPFFTVRTEGDRNDPFKKIHPANASFTILTGIPETNENVMEFYFALTQSAEGRFFVEIFKGPGNVAIFRGKILADAGDRLFNKYGDFEVTAICGLTDLKDIEFRPTGYSDLTPEFAIKTNTFVEYFYDILKSNKVVQFFKEIYHGNSQVYQLMTTMANWIESNSESGDIFAQVKMRNYYYEQKTPTYRKYKSCFEVLEDLLTGFVSRMSYSNGLYHVTQLSYMDNADPDIYRYDIDTSENLILGTSPTMVQHNYTTNNNIFARSNLIQRKLAPLKAVELEQGKQFTNFMAGMAISINGNNGPHDFGYIIGLGNKLINQWNCEISVGTGWSAASWSSQIKVEHILTFKVKIGDYYLVADDPIYNGVVNLYPNGQYHVSAGGKIPTLNWTLTDSTITFKWEKTIFSVDVNDFNNQASAWRQSIRLSDVVFESNEIQEDGEMIYTFLNFVTKRNNTIIGGFPAGTVQLRKTSRIIIASGFNDLYEQPKGIKRYEVGDTDNVLIYSFQLGYYDSPDKETLSRLFVKVTGNPDYNQIPSMEWTDLDNPTVDLPIEELMMKTTLALRTIPSNIWDMRLVFKTATILGYNDQVVIDDVVHFPIEMEMIANESGYTHYNVNLWEVYKDYDNVNVIDTGEPEVEDNPFPIPDGSLDYARTGNSPAGVEHFEEWTNVSTPYVTLTRTLSAYIPGNDYDIKTKILVRVNGVASKYTPTGTLKPREHRFDTGLDRIELGKGTSNIGHVEFIKYF